MSHYCEVCGKTMDEKEFYTSRNLEKYPDGGKLNQCKKCITMHVDNWDPETYKWILQEIDVPYVKEWWDSILEKNAVEGKKITGMTILGKYLSKMKLKQWNDKHWEDGPKIEEQLLQEKVTKMKAQGYSGEEIEEQLSKDRTPPKPKSLITPIDRPPAEDDLSVPLPLVEEEEESNPIVDQLTHEDKLMLRLKWGHGYRPEEWVRMEQLYNDMMASYDIQGAGHKDTLIMICKASLKANQLLDAGDIDGFTKMQKAYDSLMKSGKFTAAQNKGESGNVIDSIGELVAICEREGFIPRYYIDTPNDKVDRTIQDLQTYTQTLINEEANLGTMIESALKRIEEDKEREAQVDADDIDDDIEEQMFSEDGRKVLSDDDFMEFQDFEEAEAENNEEGDDDGSS